MGNQQLYDRDFYAWANEQADLLRTGRLSEADIENIAEEIATLGRSEKRELVSRLTVLLTHLLKWQYHPGLRGNSWRLTLEEQRDQLQTHFLDNPSLKSTLADSVVVAHRRAVIGATLETGLARSAFPAVCPWTTEQIMDPNFFPETSN